MFAHHFNGFVVIATIKYSRTCDKLVCSTTRYSGYIFCGLMQVMPLTASVVSKMGKIPYNDQKQLFLFQKNINIGSAYLQQLTKRFRNHPVLVAAAYNAGPRQVVHWLKTHPPTEIDEWIETLPWQETRNYLKNVIAFYVVYQYRLNQKPDLKNFLEPLGPLDNCSPSPKCRSA